MPDIPSGYIRTPGELDAAARALERSLGQTPSPIKRFLLIAEFASHIRSLPAFWLSGYVPIFAPLFVELVRMPFLRNVPPQVWTDAYGFLVLIRRLGWDRRIPGFEDAHEKAVRHAILAYAFVSSLRELHGFFIRHGMVEQTLDETDWMQIFGAANTSYGLLVQYAEVLHSIGSPVSSAVKQAAEAWAHFRGRQDAVSIILLDDEVHSRYAAGRVLLMDILPRQSPDAESHVSNLLGESGHEVVEQLNRAEQLARSMLRDRFRTSVTTERYHYSVHESSAELIGGSLGLPALAGVLSSQTRHMNLPERWSIPTTVACTGRIRSSGEVEAGSWAVLEMKLRLAFFSPLERVVIPAAHREAALHTIQMLQREFPNRILDIVGIADVRDLPNTRGVFSIITRSGMERLQFVLQRYNFLLTIILAILLLAGGGYVFYLTYYDYPNLEHARGLSVGSSAIVFNPKDSLRWCFRDGRQIREPRLPFGDLETGDGFTRTLQLWNMTPIRLHVQLDIEGSNVLDWYVNSGDHMLSVPSASSQTFSIMFAPQSSGRKKTARLVLRDPDNGRELYSMELSGAAGAPLPGGYALQFDGKDDYLYFGRRSTAFDIGTSPRRELTFECWFRPAREDRNFILLYNGIDSSGVRPIQDLVLGFDSLHTCYFRVGSQITTVNVPQHLIPAVGTWNHIALAVSLPQRRISLYLNGIPLEDLETDFLMDGFGLPYVTLGAYNDTQMLDLFFEGDLDEVRLWHRFRTGEQIRGSMRRHVDGLTPSLTGYWDMDTAVESILFNANKRAHSGTLLNRPTVVRSSVPLDEGRRDVRIVPAADDGTAVELQAGRYLGCMRPVLPRFGPATFSLRFLQTDAPTIHFYYVRTEEGWISIEDNYTFTRVARHHTPIADGWKHAVWTVSRNGELVLHVDGAAVDTNRTTVSGPYDWHRNYEGILLGFLFDTENQLNSSYYDLYHPTLSHPRAYSNFMIWDRELAIDEIRELSMQGVVPESGLRASWPLRDPPDRNGNFTDEVGGAMLHIKRVRAWE